MTDLFWPPAPVEGSEPLLPETLSSQTQTQTQRSTAWRTTAAAAGLSALVFGGVGVGVGAALDRDHGSSAVLPATALPSGSLSVVPTSYAGVAARVLPSVVSITVTTPGSGGDTGSGVILRTDGYVLTNNHVIAAAVDGGGRIAITFNDGSTSTATVVGADSQDDLAVLKVARGNLAAATLGTTSALHVGDAVIALGSPLGLQGTVTSGIVSALNRPVATSDSQPTGPFAGATTGVATVLDAIQTDAAINPGNSGGPLVNAAGQVVGINSAIASNGTDGNIGVGFAIPIDQAKVIAAQLIATGKASHPLLGVALADASDANGAPMARVQSLSSTGAAAKAGIQVGDVITAVGDQKTAGSEAVIAAVRTHQPGEHVSVTVLRNGARKTFTVTLANASNTQG
jgi:putative serine protease PepD